ncbi:MAG: glutamine synthetase family protein [archaeon]
MLSNNVELVLKKIEEDKVSLCHLTFTDINGSIKRLTIPVNKLKESLNRGTWFDGSSIEGFARIHESDLYLKPDPTTYALIPWEPVPTARFFCDVFTPNDKPFEADPREILKKQLNEALKIGFTFNTGPELEFYLFENNSSKPKPHDNAGYFDFAPLDKALSVRREILLALEKMGLKVEASHHEVGPGQHEIDFQYDNALLTADNAITFKKTVKSIAILHDLHASFMPKPLFGQAGNGMHVHQSLFKADSNENAFFDSKNKYNLSETAKQFIAGQLKHVKAITAITNPTINSYKRLIKGFEAPVYITWASINRSALIRIPRTFKENPKSTRIELRSPDPSANPYLAFTVMLAAGLDGIKNSLPLPEPVEENIYHFEDHKLKQLAIDSLPANLFEAVEELKKDNVIQKALGEKTFETILRLKKIEWKEYSQQVTEWELQKYFKST